jgi:hypothetical protein
MAVFVSFLAMNPFVRFAKRADILLDVLHKIEDNPFLMVPGMEANRTEFTDFCQCPIQ